MSPPDVTADVAVVGAGPAGLAAAVTAAAHGLSVAVLDLDARAGGQYLRRGPDGRTGHPHAPWSTLLSRFESAVAGGRVSHHARAAVWAVEVADVVGRSLPAPVLVHARVGEVEPVPLTVAARRLVVATGAYDRVLPFPGWDLPGVLAAGATQAVLRGGWRPAQWAGQVAIVAGSGPFLLPVATGLLEAGLRVAAVVEAVPPTRWARQPRGAVAGGTGRLLDLAGYVRALARHRVPYLTGHAVVAAHGDDRLRAVTVEAVDAEWRPCGTALRVDADLLAVGHGFTPQVELAVQAGCTTQVLPDGSVAVATDGLQATSRAEVLVAGESTGVGGADLALVEGVLAGLGAAAALSGRPVDAARVARLLRRRDTLRRFADALRRVHAPGPGWPAWLRDDTVVCRCEEVAVADLRSAVDLGAGDVRTAKLLARPGMGWCQGRVCGYPTAVLSAALAGGAVDADALAGVARRPVAQPVRLADLAAATATEAAPPVRGGR